jgi:hypothetical protein
VDDGALVGRVHGASQCLDEARRRAGRPGSAVEPLRQAAAGAVFQREVGQSVTLADLVHLDDVRVLQARDSLGLRPEALALSRIGAGAPRIIFSATTRLRATCSAS